MEPRGAGEVGEAVVLEAVQEAMGETALPALEQLCSRRLPLLGCCWWSRLLLLASAAPVKSATASPVALAFGFVPSGPASSLLLLPPLPLLPMFQTAVS